MDLTRDYSIRRFEGGRLVAGLDPVITETRVELDINDGEARIALLCMPADLEAMAVGFLVGEGALHRRDELHSVEVADDGRRVIICGDFDPDALEGLRLRWTWGSGCGGGGTGRDLSQPALKRLEPGPVVACERLLRLGETFGRRASGATEKGAPEVAPQPTGLWRRTGGVHACALADPQKLLLFAEDVGRHNAFDKVIGAAFLRGIDRADKIAITTGRLSAEIAAKAVAARVPILASRSAVTSLALDLARRFALTLVGFARGRRLNVYAGFERLEADRDQPEEADS